MAANGDFTAAEGRGGKKGFQHNKTKRNFLRLDENCTKPLGKWNHCELEKMDQHIIIIKQSIILKVDFSQLNALKGKKTLECSIYYPNRSVQADEY